MKLLVVGNRVPWPLHDGGAIATYGMLRSLAENGAEVDFFCFNTKKHYAENATIEKYFGFCRVHLVPLDASIRPWKALKNLFFGGSYHTERYWDDAAANQLFDCIKSKNFDCVMIEGLYSMPIALDVMQRCKDLNTDQTNSMKSNAAGEMLLPPRIWVYRSHNIEHQIWERLASTTSQFLKRWYLALQSKRLKAYEIGAWKCVNAIIPIVSTDAAVIQRDLHPEGPKIHVYQPGIAIERPFSFVHKPLSVFHIGSMEWDANVQGVMWFLQKVWPRILLLEPQAKFHLAGKGLKKEDPRFFQTGIVNHGEVEDAEDFMQSHGVMIVPIQAGSGIRIKSLEAMALGVPLVSTSVGAQGLQISSGTELIIADDPENFAKGVIELLSDPMQSQAMTEKARAYVELYHNLKRNTADLLVFLGQLKDLN